MDDRGEGKRKFETKQKVEDMMLYAYPALQQFPKSEKFAMAADIKRIMDTMLMLCIEIEKKIYRKTTLQQLDVANDQLKTFIRMAMLLKFLPFHKYEVWTGMVVEIGKMIGGMLKAAKQNADHRE